MTRNRWQFIVGLMTVMAGLCISSCEKVVLDEETAQQETQKGNVTIRASLFQVVPFSDTRAARNITDYASKLSFVIYKNGEKMIAVNQKRGDVDYGQASMNLQAGEYQLLILAHSSPYGTPTLTNPEAIKFTNKDTGYSDTFYYYGTLSVTGGEQTVDLQLQRATSMLSITINDELPAELSHILVQYEGESGVFDATTGYGGTVNSKQYVNFNVEGMKAPLTLRVYTFLRDDIGNLKSVNIIATDVEEARLAQVELTNVPMHHQMVTEYSGMLFTPMGGLNFNLTAETSWEVYGQYTF